MFSTLLKRRMATAGIVSTFLVAAAAETRAADVHTVYDQAIKDYRSQNYSQSCRELKQLAEVTGQFKSLPADIVAQTKQNSKNTSELSHAAMLAGKNRKT